MPSTPAIIDADDWPAGTVVLDDFCVERELGRGAMGRVYLLRSADAAKVQYAVKRARRLTEEGRRQLLWELQTWKDLPRHPHVVTCWFFRTVGEDICIFAEYVPGVTLSAWTSKAELTLAQVLDFAIQLAWGLHAAHVWGVVHQDVKPGNVLVGDDGIVKLCDFGLARARRDVESRAGGLHDTSDPYVTAVGGTPAYWSPEQSRGMPLTPRSDLWSWAVTVLELFAGSGSSGAGHRAPDWLEQYLLGDPVPGRPAMPDAVAALLRACFVSKPFERPGTLLEVAGHLEQLYSQALADPYPRAQPEFKTRPARSTDSFKPEFGGERGRKWMDGRSWLLLALDAASRSPRDLNALLPTSAAATLEGQTLWDLVGMSEAVRIFDEIGSAAAVCDGRTLVALYMDKARLHAAVSDWTGAFAMYDRAIGILTDNAAPGDWSKRTDQLASAYWSKANALLSLGQAQEAIAWYDRALAIDEHAVDTSESADCSERLALTYLNKAIALQALNNPSAALALQERAQALYEDLAGRDGAPEVAEILANIYASKANTLYSRGEYEAAITLYDKALSIRERLVEPDGGRRNPDRLAVTYANKANAVESLGDAASALLLHDKALGLLESLAHREGRQPYESELAACYSNKGAALESSGDPRAAVESYDLALRIYERGVESEGRFELAGALAQTRTRKASALRRLGDFVVAVDLYERAIAIQQRLVAHEPLDLDAARTLASMHTGKGTALESSGDAVGALNQYDKALEILDRLAGQDDRYEAADDLAAAYTNNAKAIRLFGVPGHALSFYERALEIREALVPRANARQLLDCLESLAFLHANKADVLSGTGDPTAAVASYGRARTLYEDLVQNKGRSGLVDKLAIVIGNTGLAMHELGDLPSAVALTNAALRIVEWLLLNQNRIDLARLLANHYAFKKILLTSLGYRNAVVKSCEQAVGTFRQLTTAGSNPALRGLLSWMELDLADALIEGGQRELAEVLVQPAMDRLLTEVEHHGRSELQFVVSWARDQFREHLNAGA